MKKYYGSLEVICGPMFAGKTKTLVRRARRAKEKIQIFRPESDTRSHTNQIMSHDGILFPAISVAAAKDILKNIKHTTAIIGIDEGQFFGKQLVPVTHRLLESGYHVIISGLSVMYNGKPFPPLPELMAEAEKVVKLTARCARCKKSAAFHVRTAPFTSKNRKGGSFIGGAESYIPLCRSCAKDK